MKFRILLCVLAALAAFALPFLLLPKAAPQEAPPVTEPSVPETVQTAPVESFDDALTLRVQTEDGVRELSLHDYLTGVVLAEMPTDFAPEALKAQAVASRTYALRKAAARKHADADICGSFSCCQAWIPTEDYTGTEALAKAAQAVRETDGLVVTYDGALIDATFFSCAAGSTESALAVWGSDVPYLQAVESPEHEERYEESVTVLASEFAAVLRERYPEIALDGGPETWFGAQTCTAGGGLDTVEIGGISLRGTELRTLFSLRSTVMTLTPEPDGVKIATSGYGHRVGLSQYGADVLAAQGEDFEEILLHYYRNTQLEHLHLE